MDELVSNLEKLLSTSPLQDKYAAENQQSLIGKTIRHKWCNEDREQWYTGHILSAVEKVLNGLTYGTMVKRVSLPSTFMKRLRMEIWILWHR